MFQNNTLKDVTINRKKIKKFKLLKLWPHVGNKEIRSQIEIKGV